MPSLSKEPPAAGGGVPPKEEIHIQTDLNQTNGLSSEEVERQKKLGAFIVQNNIASAEKVFGTPSMRSPPDLLLINRSNEDALRHPKVWYKPWTWFTGGQQVGALQWSERHGAPEPFPAVRRPEAAPAPIEEVEPEVEPRKVIKKKSGLPPVRMEIMKESEVQTLTPKVKEERDMLRQSEARIHQLLQGIEDTRYRYLIPSQDLKCEKEVTRVLRCYEKENEKALQKKHEIMRQREKELMSGVSNQVHSTVDLEKPVITTDVLNCAGLVKQLKTCTSKMVETYSANS
ncbi:hypothetical protein AGDE_00007 [Angomonas deanei]|nr:hypothetical protein AGDE_06741 [Angomonas deanei]EPY43913.1 hypothetical protein AGDE_00007 [Angomonas deanei]|eukprot:EPY36790.1 hypothetical protein AGDE_06741 [Angomonas deanei]